MRLRVTERGWPDAILTEDICVRPEREGMSSTPYGRDVLALSGVLAGCPGEASPRVVADRPFLFLGRIGDAGALA